MSQELLAREAIVFIIIFVAALYFFTLRVRNGQIPALRRIQAFEMLKGLHSQAVETGRNLHLSLGTGGLVNETTADTLAGINVLNYLAEQAATTGVPPTISMADPMAMLFTQNALRAAYAGNAERAEEAYRYVRWIAPQPAAYAAGVVNLLNINKAEANIMLGYFGDEYLLMGESAAQRGIAQVCGASNPNTLPFVYATAQEALLGEEVYAAGAYLQKRPAHLASLVAQDSMRWLIALVILGGVIMASLR